MGRFDISPEVAEEFRTKFREAVMPHVDEDILAVGTFRTTGSGTKFAVSKLQAGAAVYGAVSKLGRARAGGLPNTFLLVVTPTKLRAFKYKLKGRGVQAREEVAAWDRAGLKVTTSPMQTTTTPRRSARSTTWSPPTIVSKRSCSRSPTASPSAARSSPIGYMPRSIL